VYNSHPTALSQTTVQEKEDISEIMT